MVFRAAFAVRAIQRPLNAQVGGTANKAPFFRSLGKPNSKGMLRHESAVFVRDPQECGPTRDQPLRLSPSVGWIGHAQTPAAASCGGDVTHGRAFRPRNRSQTPAAASSGGDVTHGRAFGLVAACEACRRVNTGLTEDLFNLRLTRFDVPCPHVRLAAPGQDATVRVFQPRKTHLRHRARASRADP